MMERFEKLKKSSGKSDLFKESQIDLQDWLEPYTDVNFGIKPHQFLKKFLDKNLAEADLSKLGFMDLKLCVSLLKFLDCSDQILVDKMESTISESFPPILLLMNINGCLVHRTDAQVQFSGDTEYYVKCFKHKKHHHYYREGHMAFLKSIMRHPRVKFGFNSSIMRRNIMPIIQNMFIA